MAFEVRCGHYAGDEGVYEAQRAEEVVDGLFLGLHGEQAGAANTRYVGRAGWLCTSGQRREEEEQASEGLLTIEMESLVDIGENLDRQPREAVRVIRVKGNPSRGVDSLRLSVSVV